VVKRTSKRVVRAGTRLWERRLVRPLLLGCLFVLLPIFLLACDLELPSIVVNATPEPEVIIVEKIVEVEKEVVKELEVEKGVEKAVVLEVEKLGEVEVETETIVVDLPDETKSRQGKWTLDVDPKTGTMTLHAKDASLLGILGELNTKFQIDVIVSNLADIRVTVDIDSVPLDEGLAALIPAESRFHFRVEDADIAIKMPKLGDQISARQRERARTDLPSMDDRTRPVSDDLRTEVMLPPEDVRERQTDGGRLAKVHPEKILEGSLDWDAIQANARLPEEGGYARIVLYITSEGVTVEGFLELEGSLVQSTTVKGELIYMVVLDGKPVAVGSMQDPLEVHTAEGEGHEHELEKEKEALFLISLPEEFLSQSTLERTTIAFYYLEPVGPIPSVLTPETFNRFEPHLRPIARIGGDEIIKTGVGLSHRERNGDRNGGDRR